MATGNLSHRSGDLPARQAAAQGFALLSQDGLSQAKALFDQALASSPDCLAARLGLALLSEDYRQARRLCPEMLEVEKTLRGPMLLTYLAGFAAVGDEKRCLWALENGALACEHRYEVSQRTKANVLAPIELSAYEPAFVALAALNRPKLNEAFALQYYASPVIRRLVEAAKDEPPAFRSAYLYRGRETGYIGGTECAKCMPLAIAAALGAQDLFNRLVEQAQKTHGTISISARTELSFCFPGGRAQPKPYVFQGRCYPTRYLYTEALESGELSLLELLPDLPLDAGLIWVPKIIAEVVASASPEAVSLIGRKLYSLKRPQAPHLDLKALLESKTPLEITFPKGANKKDLLCRLSRGRLALTLLGQIKALA